MPLQMHKQIRKCLKAPSLILLLTRLPFAFVETGISLRALGNPHVMTYKSKKDIHLPSKPSGFVSWKSEHAL